MNRDALLLDGAEGGSEHEVVARDGSARRGAGPRDGGVDGGELVVRKTDGEGDVTDRGTVGARGTSHEWKPYHGKGGTVIRR